MAPLFLVSLSLLVLAIIAQPRLGLGLGFYSERSGWEWVSSFSIGGLNTSEFKAMATPLVQICANTYRYPSSRSIAGWKASEKVSPIGPSTGGVHALVYEEQVNDDDDEEESPSRIVVAFRGTQISDPVQGLADLCAGMLLWNECPDYSSLPIECTSRFNESTLDYLTPALAYTELVIQAYPNSHSILLTGHSLGAGLAILVSLAVSEQNRSIELPVIGFSARGPRNATLFERHSLSDYLDRFITIALEWDEVVRATLDEQVGFLCLYEEEEPSSCQLCFSSLSSRTMPGLPSVDENDDDINKFLPQGDCYTCFLETHVLKQVINAVAKGEKPTCQSVVSQNDRSMFVMA